MHEHRWIQVDSSLGWVKERCGLGDCPTARHRRVKAPEWTFPAELVRAKVRVESWALAFQLLDVGRDVAKQLDRREDAARVARAIARPPLFG
jgi:hypothetical protein